MLIVDSKSLFQAARSHLGGGCCCWRGRNASFDSILSPVLGFTSLKASWAVPTTTTIAGKLRNFFMTVVTFLPFLTDFPEQRQQNTRARVQGDD